MDVRLQIVDMEAALSSQSQSVAQLCRAAGIAQTSWVRWKNGTAARESTWARVQKAFAEISEGAVLPRAAA